jgi:hypothetical protein
MTPAFLGSSVDWPPLHVHLSQSHPLFDLAVDACCEIPVTGLLLLSKSRCGHLLPNLLAAMLLS